jgi:hypothetical protein
MCLQIFYVFLATDTLHACCISLVVHVTQLDGRALSQIMEKIEGIIFVPSVILENTTEFVNHCDTFCITGTVQANGCRRRTAAAVCVL